MTMEINLNQPLAELERNLNVEHLRALISEAARKRMRLATPKQRAGATLSQFMARHEADRAWFVHDKAQIPICRGWPREA